MGRPLRPCRAAMSEAAPAPAPAASPEPAAGGRAGPLLTPLAAITLLTVLPIPRAFQARIGAREVAGAAPWFPLVGGLLGALCGAVAWVVAEHGGPVLAGAVAASLMAASTGALHLDGLADSADALGARGGRPERRLEIMRDSATGAYGAVAIAAWFALTVAAVGALPGPHVVLALAWAGVLSRTAAVLHSAALPPARPGGLGAGFSVSLRSAIVAVIVAAGVGVVLAAGEAIGLDSPVSAASLGIDSSAAGDRSGPLALPGLVATLASTAAVAIVGIRLAIAARRLVGGRTGDTLGATISLTEVAALLALAIALAP